MNKDKFDKYFKELLIIRIKKLNNEQLNWKEAVIMERFYQFISDCKKIIIQKREEYNQETEMMSLFWSDNEPEIQKPPEIKMDLVEQLTNQSLEKLDKIMESKWVKYDISIDNSSDDDITLSDDELTEITVV